MSSSRSSLNDYSVALAELNAAGYKVKSILGVGGFGTVVEAFHKTSKQQVAIKFISKNTAAATKSNVALERTATQELSHQNIVKLLDVLETTAFLYLVFELYEGGDVRRFLKERKQLLSESEVQTMFKQLVQAVEYAHEKGFVHRDIKPENLLLSATGVVKLSDWGLAQRWSPDVYVNGEPLGSVPYLSPELALRQPYVGPEVDVWSMGVTLYVLASGGRHPFRGTTKEEVVQSVLATSDDGPTWPKHFSRDLKDLLKRMLAKDPKVRLTIEQIKHHPWVVATRDEEEKVEEDVESSSSSNSLTVSPTSATTTSSSSGKEVVKCPLVKAAQMKNSKGKLLLKGLVQRMHKALSVQ
eukprot:TRINITY_DN535_c0_g2_i1.p1 TRINITY_DN535_c0_g2~~TRINITY_DN535_c0_g2_i1.p1  ORF type:complete len:355 (-),score=68.63 TRINITY_DN535_c0_g2_i1:278-1342(-)